MASQLLYVTGLVWLFVALPMFPAAAQPVATNAASLRIDNRAPKDDEIGYRPADGQSVRLNPPSLIWLHETVAQNYAVQWGRTPDFRAAQRVAGLPFNTYTHEAKLAPGKYFWRYQFADKNGATSNWSATRSFVVPADAIDFPMPNRVQQLERVPKAHPRLFMRPEDLPRLRELARTREADRFTKLRAVADKLLTSEPTPEPAVRASNRDPQTRAFWWPNRVQTLKALDEAETLAFVYLLTQEAKYGQAARKWILHLAAWNPDGPTNWKLNDEAAMPMIHRLPRAYDWAYGALSEADREIVRAAMRRRGEDAWNSGEIARGVGHLNRPYNSHGNRAWHKLGEAGIAFLGEIPEAATWLDYAVNKFYAAYPVWSDDDGGWHEGVHYWAGYLSKVVWWLQVAKSALQIDGLRKPFFAQVGDFPLYAAPPNAPNEGFGDLSYNRPSKGWGGFTEYFQRAAAARGEKTNAAHWRWWSQEWKMNAESGILGFLYAANLGALPEAKAPVDLPQSKVFHGIGVASLHTTLLDAGDDVHFLFKSSPFGSQSHGHQPQNAFMLNAYGDELLTATTFRDHHGSPFHYQWVHSTRAQNAVLVNGQGQVMHKAGAQGRIVAEQLSPTFDYIAGDATTAYEGRLKRFVRHVAFAKPDVIVLFDDIEAAQPAQFQWMLHALQAFEVDEKNGSVSLLRTQAGVRVKYLSPLPLAFRQWDGYDPKPEKEFPNQWHVEAGTTEKKSQIAMLTVIVPQRAGKAQEWNAERLESPTALGVRLTRAGQSTLIGFRKPGIAGRATLGDWTFDAPAAMK